MNTLRPLTFAAALTFGLAGPGAAACFADYKAKQDDPLRLHYGVVELSDAACASPDRAAAEVRQRLAEAGWQLLTVMGTFGEEGLEGRRASAGEFYLRY